MPIHNGSTKVTLSVSNGSTASILLFGATLISWKSPSPASPDAALEERFFLSSKSALDGSKPVRGGIPIVFPFFGPSTKEEHSKLSSHGFARSENWTYGGVVLDNEDAVSVKFDLEPTSSIQAKYAAPFKLTYIVTLSSHQLSTGLHITNPSTTTPLVHQALLHNYLLAPSSSVSVTPLTGLHYIDKVAQKPDEIESRPAVTVTSFTDSVYKSAGGDYHVRWTGGGIDIKTTGFGDVVVWNPQAEAGAKIGDLEEGGWEKFVCVEPGIASYWNEIQPGESWIGTQTFYPI